MGTIKNIVFDLGVVILNVNYSRTLDAFTHLGLENAEQVYSKSNQIPCFDQLEKGEIGPVAFCEALRVYLPSEVTDESIVDAWNAMLGELPVERLELLESVKKHYRMFLLSNTNELHVASYLKTLKQTHGLDNLSHVFEKEYYSHKVGMRKPDKEIFDFVLDDNGLDASETVFIDDSIQHVRGAEKAGIMAIHLDDSKTLLDLFETDGRLKS